MPFASKPTGRSAMPSLVPSMTTLTLRLALGVILGYSIGCRSMPAPTGAREATSPKLEAEALPPPPEPPPLGPTDHHVAEWYWKQAEKARKRGTPAWLRRSVEQYDCAAELYAQSGDELGEARARNAGGLAWFELDDYDEAEAWLSTALSIREREGDAFERAQTLNNLGLVQLGKGLPKQAYPYFLRALPLWQEAEKPMETAFTWNCMGGAWDQLDQPAAALEQYRKAYEVLDHYQEEEALWGKAFVANNIGVVLNYLNELDRASSFLEMALAIWPKLDNPSGEAQTLNNLGWTRRLQGDPEAALDLHRRALSKSGAIRDRAFSLHNIGVVHFEQNRLRASERYFNRALELRESMQDHRSAAYSHYSLARTAALLGNPDADDRFKDTLHRARKVGDVALEIETLVGLASLARSRQDPASALTQVNQAIDLSEHQRVKVPHGDMRAEYLATKMRAYQLRIDLFLDLHRQRPTEGFDGLALAATEAARARSLADSLRKTKEIRDFPYTESNRDTTSGKRDAAGSSKANPIAEPHVTEPFMAASLEDSAGSRLSKALDSPASSPGGPESAVAKLLESRTAEAAAWLDTVRTSLLGEEDLLIYFWLGDDRGYAWILDRETLISVELPARAALVGMIRTTSYRAKHHVINAQSIEIAARNLSEALFGDLSPYLTKHRLILVLDPGLLGVAFAALPLPRGCNPGTDETWMIDRFELIQTPSIQTLALLPQVPVFETTETATVAVFANPTYTPTNERKSTPPPSPPTGQPSARLTDASADPWRSPAQTELVPLPFSRTEAMNIQRIVGPGRTVIRLGPSAARLPLLRGFGRDHRILHFATHATSDSARPERSGLWLSTWNEEGKAVNGLLNLHEIYGLELNAGLVVLSACETARGAEIRGEGALSLARGFMVSGTPRVVASLWRVSDEGTAHLMTHFYEGVFQRQLAPAAALRRAQLALRSSGDWSSPYYWAGFQLYGRWD
ncbi:CHAT domain-containing protein [Sulfidibacter corallicola]|uniref:CHAT domain-containing protein n=1 Tax=Sulfidibacter corallicola TaxID=2818388 RepID=A0A8A4TMA3_SULCO|nr:CHAT domain-containing tetratricopeptide repeat protein [Sulfidibacter corallicola]QTD50597.1 CHAT domain-containing protein [Sulfidibacter corallicola]